ncbi:MAG: hypothetical protein KC933_36865, partial [Myxococcales bacterium]|nr:hypothetical protein [Myxococcales bacterium]
LQAARGGALTTTPGAAARAAGLLELWLARDPGRSAAAFTPAELYAFMAVRRAAFAGELATQPAELYASPYDVLYAGTASGAPPAQGAPRAKALVEAVGYRPMADDLWVLGRQRPEDVETITSFLGGLKQAGLTFERRYHGFGPLGSPVQGELTHLLSRLPWRSPEGRAGVLAAAAELVALGSPLRPSEAALLAEMAGGTGAARARVVLARTAPLDDPRDADYVVKVAREAARFGDDAALAAGLDALGARLGRRPTVPEAAQVLEALQAGAQLEALIPVGGGALAVADLYAWSRAPARYTAAPEAHLRAELDARVSQAFLRLDSNAEYAETSSAAFGAPKLVKMHMLLDALQAPAVRGALADALSADLADGAWEHGGLVKAEGGVATFDVIPSASQDSTAATYLLPAAHEPLPALAKFHFHAVNADGELHRSGPSSVALGQGADRGVTYLYQQDEVVISALDVDAAGRVTRFNVDFVATDGAVRDLGTFTR